MIEIENVIKNISKSIDIAVIGYPKLLKNNHSFNDLIAFVNNTVREEDCVIFKKINKKIPFYCIPKKIIRLKNFPLSVNGKIDYDKLYEYIK